MRKPYFNLVVVIALLFGLVATVPTKVALADCSPDNGTDILCTGTDTNGVVTDGGGSNINPDVVVVEAGATVDTTTGGCDAIDSAGALSVFNDGAITGDCAGIDVDDDLIDLTNTGIISGYGSDAVNVSDDLDGTLNNSEFIIGEDNGVNIGDDLNGTINNSGNISGDNYGVYIDDALNGTITNSGNIIGGNDSGIVIDAESPNSGSIANTGTIGGYYVGIYSDSYVEVYNSGDIVGLNGNGINFGDQNIDSGYLENNTGGEVWGYEDGANFSGEGVVYNDGLVFGLLDDAVDIGGNGLVVNDVNGVIDGLNNGVNIGGDGLVVNSGEILAYNGDGIDIGGYAIIYNDGFIWGDDEGIDTASGYATYIYSSGTIIGNSTAIDTGDYNDVVVLDSGSLTIGGDDDTLELNSGDDTVVLGAGSVSYSAACGNINVTNVDNRAATVIGLMDGGDDTDTLVFSILTPNQGAVNNLDAYLASLGGTNTAAVNGQIYDYANFEYYGINATVYTEGPTRLFDDGVVLGFATSGGIAVCSGEKGFRAGTVDMVALDNGQREFSAGNDGWFVRVTDLGGGRFEAHIFDGSGKERFNDADGNGKADSTFVFSR